MALVRYHRYVGELWEDLDLGELVGELSDFLLQSGFGTEEEGEMGEDQLQALHDAILDALMRRGLLSDEDLQKLLDDGDALEQFLDKVVERMVREGYLTMTESRPFHDPTQGRGGFGPAGPPVKFELTEKASPTEARMSSRATLSAPISSPSYSSSNFPVSEGRAA